MSKLFALETESNKVSGNDLLIDKLLDKKEEEETSPLSLTANLLKQRNTINADIKEHIEQHEDKMEELEEGDDSTEEDEQDEEQTSESKEKEAEEDGKDAEDDSGDSADESDDDEDVEALVGSELNKDAPEDSAEGKGVATESHQQPVSLRNCFSPLHNSYQGYLIALESIAEGVTPIKDTEQPVVHVKDSVLESLNRLTSVAFTYVESNQAFIDKTSKAVTELNERVSVFATMVEEGKYHFTHKLVSDKDILANIALNNGHSSIRETVRALNTYTNFSNKAVTSVLSNEFEELRNAFLTQGFVEDDTDLVYAKPIPGFNMVKVGMVPYTNYLKTKVENYQYYKLKVMKTEDLYNLPAISVTEDKDIVYITESLQQLMFSTSVSLDSLTKINEHFTEFTDGLKVMAYNVENDQYKSLADLQLDNKVKDFIRFKLVMEVSYINVNLILDYMTSVISALNLVLELKE